ncbi:LOW QUALITY PROTEIN: uncharacterized protein At1g28695-like [Chenopodium quinoa]|uniref:LOW QUALITY PROTEIN: uncharacterized protein At1g28695-like n=1 Tax=Chenopodium quinoa TaxID=63459 RepID=UPI000B7771EA|nr:LOW QUALITY PROTEIN: uncharacterized protein At1g28695-like [Chenopodium quinoa]
MEKPSNYFSIIMDSNKNPFFYSIKNISIILLLIVGVFSLSFLSSFSSKSLLSSKFLQCPSLPRPNETAVLQPFQKDELDEALEKASMKDNKTVIIAVVNKAYVEGEVVPNMLDLFLEGFWAGENTRELVNHLMIVAVDQTAYDRCRYRGLHCYRLVTDGVDFMGEKIFMSKDFIKMMWSRTLFLTDILKKGYNFIFTDTDVVWLRNPLKVLTTNRTRHFDIQLSTDNFNGNSSSTSNAINTGFYFVKSNNKTISLFEKWYGLKDNSTGLKEQDVLQNMIWHGELKKMGIRARFLNTRYFSGFCQDSRDIRSVVTVHSNCCRYISAKVADLRRVLHDWGRFKAAPANVTRSLRWSPHVECVKSWRRNNVESGNKI